MSNELRFLATKIRKIVEITKENPQFSPPYGLGGDLNDPSLILVKDDGAYLMAHATIRTEDDVVYAAGFSPTCPDSYERCREVLGGDDFAEPIPVTMIEEALEIAEKNGHPEYLCIVATDEHFSFE